MDVAELLGVSLTVEHLLPALSEMVIDLYSYLTYYSLNKMMEQIQKKDISSLFLTKWENSSNS